MDKFFDSYFDILMNRAGHFEKRRKSLPKFYLQFWRYLEKKIGIVQDLKRFFPHWKTCFISSVGMVETSCSYGFYILYVPNFKGLG